MPATTGTTKLYYGFLRHLAKPSVKRRIAPLQLAGKIEDYLTKEFVAYILNESEGSRFAIVNSGRKGEPKIDMAVIRSGRRGHVAEAFIEAKYFRNRHRLLEKDMGAIDEHSTSLKELETQAGYLPSETHGQHAVLLRARTAKVYGLVFASYTRPDRAEDRKEEYFSSFLAAAAGFGFRYHDLHRPYMRSAFEDHPAMVLGERWRISLRCGLWRLPAR